MKGSAWFETFAAIFCFYTFQSLTAYKIIEKKRNNKTFSEKVSKKVMRGGTVVKRRGAAEHDSSNKRDDI